MGRCVKITEENVLGHEWCLVKKEEKKNNKKEKKMQPSPLNASWGVPLARHVLFQRICTT